MANLRKLAEVEGKKYGLTKKIVRPLVAGLIDEVQKVLSTDEAVKIDGFGRLEILHMKPRKARDLSNNTEMVLPSRKKIVFRGAKGNGN